MLTPPAAQSQADAPHRSVAASQGAAVEASATPPKPPVTFTPVTFDATSPAVAHAMVIASQQLDGPSTPGNIRIIRIGFIPRVGYEYRRGTAAPPPVSLQQLQQLQLTGEPERREERGRDECEVGHPPLREYEDGEDHLPMNAKSTPNQRRLPSRWYYVRP